MWIFGYGSLIWKVDFPYKERMVGYIKGYQRRFWQASIDHRGTPEYPGRVVTLVPSDDPDAQVWGVAYEIGPDDQDLVNAKLGEREKRYKKLPAVPFYSREMPLLPKEVMVYVGPTDGPLFLGSAPIEEIAARIMNARGPSGENIDYLLQLHEFMKSECPEAPDEHLALIVEAEKVWGVAYLVSQEVLDDVIQHLDHREKGGYEKVKVTFYPEADGMPFTVDMYHGLPTNPFYIGPESIDSTATRIAKSVGPSGKNTDYLCNLVHALNELTSEGCESYLRSLYQAVKNHESMCRE
ncbi:unnamed protein product [Darwinula stevensoni]|uniref:glutathione-specific gamma-glutamylcyclotransferase n=1 Tax=Darwinula stevensoni TaxID=69355 RepID=A0A7R8X591_9CRUS|nr:unnamed protein product [Darwinula stevensoni]CAG0884535.1 unnamed protein product [Darwinula stevensoni]